MTEFYEGYELEKTSKEYVEFLELVNVFIGKSEYHKSNFEKRSEGKRKFNGAAFFFNGYWLLTRGMLLYGALFVLGILILAFIVPDQYFRAVGFGTQVVLGFAGNKLYYNFIEKQVNSVMFALDDQESRVAQLIKKRKRNQIIGTVLIVLFVSFSIWGAMLSI